MTITHALLYAVAFLPLLVTIPLRKADIRAQRAFLKTSYAESDKLEKAAERASFIFEAVGYAAITANVVALVAVHSYLNP